MEAIDPICFPTICADRPSSPEDTAGSDLPSSTNCPSVALPTVVSNTAGESDGLSNPVTTKSDTSDQSQGRISSSDQSKQPPTSRLESFRQGVNCQEISEEAFDLLCSAWRRGTEKSYTTAWNHWSSWCTRREINSFTPTIGQVLEFLTEEFKTGKQYSTINSYRSALSATLAPIDGFLVGQHPLVCKLLQGVFNRRPPAPRYTSMWNVSTVVSHILKMPPVLPLKELSKKLAMLLALSNASRSSDLHALDLRYRAFHEGGVTFKIPTLTKMRRSGPPKEVSFTAFDQDPTLCPVATLKQYEDKTTFFRHTDNSQRLFLSF